MDRTRLEMFLPAFMLTAACLLLFWTFLRKVRRVRVIPTKGKLIKRMTRITTGYLMLFALSEILTLLYVYWPEYYDWMLPIDLLDHPTVNATGIMILQVSLGWLVVAQLSIDKVVFQVNSGLDEWSYQRLALYSQRLFLSGLLVMFFGVFVTISSLGTIVICLLGMALFERLPKAIS